jgi:hypothetical protein
MTFREGHLFEYVLDCIRKRHTEREKKAQNEGSRHRERKSKKSKKKAQREGKMYREREKGTKRRKKAHREEKTIFSLFFALHSDRGVYIEGNTAVK